MKHNRAITTAVLVLLVATTLPAFAQKGEEEKGGSGGRPQQAQPQHEQQAQHEQQPQHVQQAQPQHAQQAQHQQQPQHVQQAQRSSGQQQTIAYNNQDNGNRNNSSHYGRISNANYSSHFGEGHSFHMGHPQMIGGYNRFQYGGYWFGYNQGWPVGWDYNDDCYVEYIDGAYYMFDVRHPGFRLTLNIF